MANDTPATYAITIAVVVLNATVALVYHWCATAALDTAASTQFALLSRSGPSTIHCCARQSPTTSAVSTSTIQVPLPHTKTALHTSTATRIASSAGTCPGAARTSAISVTPTSTVDRSRPASR